MPVPMTTAALKRMLTVGTKVTLIEYRIGGSCRPHKWMNVTREVRHVQSNALCLGVPGSERPDWSWSDWPKKGELTQDDDGKGFIINDGVVYLHYRLGDAV